jgi:hypothetical protein
MGAVTLMIGRAREGDRGALQLDKARLLLSHAVYGR